MAVRHPDQPRVLAAYPSRADADRAAARIRESLDGVTVRVDDPEDTLDAVSLGKQREMGETLPGISVGVMSGAQARGALVWGLAGLVVGAVLFAPLGFLFTVGDLPKWAIALFFGFCGALGVSSATFVYGGGRQPEIEGETRATTDDVILAVETTAPPEAARKVLVETGALDVIITADVPAHNHIGRAEAPRRHPA